MATSWTPTLLIGLGLAAELAGIVLGALEIRATRKATRSFLGRVRTVYLSAHSRMTTGVSGRAQLSIGGVRLVPTIDERVKAVEGLVTTLQERIRSLPAELEKLWREDLESVMRTRDHADRDYEAAIDTFVGDLGSGSWRRWSALTLLVAGVCLQAAAIAVSL